MPKQKKDPLLLQLMELADPVSKSHYHPDTGEPIYNTHQDKHGKWWMCFPDGDRFSVAVAAIIADRVVDPIAEEMPSDGILASLADDLRSFARAFEELAETVEGLDVN